jgi:hypothetical protein
MPRRLALAGSLAALSLTVPLPALAQARVGVPAGSGAFAVAAHYGFRLGTRALFAGAGVLLTTIDESDPVFTITAGVVPGGAR